MREGERLKACKRIGGQVQRKTEYRSKETGGRVSKAKGDKS